MSVDFNASFSGSAETFGAKMTETPASMTASMKETGGGSASNYEALRNKPKINGHELIGDMTPAQLGITDDRHHTHKQAQAAKVWTTVSTAYRGDRGKTAYDHSQSAHAPADAEKNVQSDWNETDGNSDAFIKNKPAIPKAVTKTVQTLSDAASKSFTVTGYILSVILIDSVTKEQVIGDVSFENATASANGKVTVTLSAAPSNPILVIITSIAL